MLLVDYDYYSDEYEGSSIPESSFESKAIEASSKVNHYTSNRINDTNINDDIRNTACQIAELLFEQEKIKLSVIDDTNKEIASESLGPRSVSYVNKSSLKASQILNEDELENKIYKIIYQNLVHTGLMYRGALQ